MIHTPQDICKAHVVPIVGPRSGYGSCMSTNNDIARRLLADYGLTYADFAHHAEVTERTVGRWVRDEANAPHKAIRRAITKLGADPAAYGIRGISITPQAQVAAPLVEQDRHDMILMAARIEAMEQNILSLCDHFNIDTKAVTLV